MKNIIILIIIIISGCKGSTYYREKHGLIVEYNEDCYIQSIRVDDDAEYHIVAISKSGNVETIKDADDGWNINIKYGNYSKPILRYKISDRCCGEGNFAREDIPEVLIPWGYKIDTFDD